MKFCPRGQSEIRFAPGEISSCEPVKLLALLAVMEFRSPGVLPFFITTAASGGNFTIRRADNFTLALGENFTVPTGTISPLGNRSEILPIRAE